MPDSKAKICSKECAEKRAETERRAEIAALRGMCAILAVKYPKVFRDEYLKFERKTGQVLC